MGTFSDIVRVTDETDYFYFGCKTCGRIIDYDEGYSICPICKKDYSILKIDDEGMTRLELDEIAKKWFKDNDKTYRNNYHFGVIREILDEKGVKDKTFFNIDVIDHFVKIYEKEWQLMNYAEIVEWVETSYMKQDANEIVKWYEEYFKNKFEY